jgi:hypothetical protein
VSYPVYYVPAGDVVPIFFSTYGRTNGESITMTGLAVTDIEVYKDGSVTQRASDAGYTLLDTDGIDFDSITGIHGFSIDTGDNTDAGFYAVGAWYHVVVSAVTVDGQTVSFIAAAFRIMAAEDAAGVPDVNVTHFGGSAGTFASGRPEVNTSHVAGTAQTAGDIIADTNDIQTRLPAALVGGRMASNAEVVGDKTGYALSAAGVQAIWDALTAALTTANSIGKLLVDNINATISSRLSTADATTEFDAVDAALVAIDNFVDTEVDAIYNRIGAPAGASIAADIADVEGKVDDLETRLTAALASKLSAHAAAVLTLTVGVGSTTTACVFSAVEGGAPSTTDDFYNGRVIIFTSGVLAGQAVEITDYTGASGTATISAATSAPANGVTAVIV